MVALFRHAWKFRILSQEETIHYIMATSLASIDNYIGVWKKKKQHDAPRPFTAIKHLHDTSLINGEKTLRSSIIFNIVDNLYALSFIESKVALYY